MNLIAKSIRLFALLTLPLLLLLNSCADESVKKEPAFSYDKSKVKDYRKVLDNLNQHGYVPFFRMYQKTNFDFKFWKINSDEVTFVSDSISYYNSRKTFFDQDAEFMYWLLSFRNDTILSSDSSSILLKPFVSPYDSFIYLPMNRSAQALSLIFGYLDGNTIPAIRQTDQKLVNKQFAYVELFLRNNNASDLAELRYKWSVSLNPNQASISTETMESSQYTDSAHYYIVRRSHPSGIRYLEVISNKLTKLDSYKEYHQNGKPKQQGLMTTGDHNYVGTWKYYDWNGKVESTFNYDKKYPVSYFAALKIAEKKGFKMPEMEITLAENESHTYWQITRPKPSDSKNIQHMEILEIDVKTGKAIKPNYQQILIID